MSAVYLECIDLTCYHDSVILIHCRHLPVPIFITWCLNAKRKGGREGELKIVEERVRERERNGKRDEERHRQNNE